MALLGSYKLVPQGSLVVVSHIDFLRTFLQRYPVPIPELRCSILQNLVIIWLGVKRDMVLKAILIRTHISRLKIYRYHWKERQGVDLLVW